MSVDVATTRMWDTGSLTLGGNPFFTTTGPWFEERHYPSNQETNGSGRAYTTETFAKADMVDIMDEFAAADQEGARQNAGNDSVTRPCPTHGELINRESWNKEIRDHLAECPRCASRLRALANVEQDPNREHDLTKLTYEYEENDSGGEKGTSCIVGATLALAATAVAGFAYGICQYPNAK